MTDLSAEAHAVQSVAVIAAWCENPTHLPVLDSAVQEYLEEPEHFRACSTVARNWDPTEAASPALRSLLESQSRQGSQHHSASSLPQLSAAEISQRSVDLLLREYYQMMQAQQHAVRAKQPDGSVDLLAETFLLLCPALPDCCSLRALYKATAWIVSTAASVTVVLACVIIPLWLLVVRQLVRQQQPIHAAVAAVAGMVLLLIAEAVHSSAAAGDQAASWAVATPASISAMMDASAGLELTALRQVHRKQMPDSVESTFQVDPQQSAVPTDLPPVLSDIKAYPRQPPATRAVVAAAARPLSPGGLSYLSLIPTVAQLQAALGVCSVEPPTTRERLLEETIRLCQILGVPVTVDKLSTAVGMSDVLTILQQHVGV